MNFFVRHSYARAAMIKGMKSINFSDNLLQRKPDPVQFLDSSISYHCVPVPIHTIVFQYQLQF